MANRKQSNNLKESLKTIRQINWFDGIHILPNNVDKMLLDQCSDIIQEFIDSNESLLPKKRIQKKAKVQKRQVLKAKKTKIKVRKIKQSKSTKIPRKIKLKAKKLKKIIQPFNYTNKSSNNDYPCYPSSFPCFRSCGPINCPKNKLPMPRDLWYRIAYSQILEQQQHGSGEAFVSPIQSPSKRKHQEDETVTENVQNNKLISNHPPQQQTMNAAISSTLTKIIRLDASLKDDEKVYRSEWNQEILQSIPSNTYKPFPMDNLEYIAESLPLEIEHNHSESRLIDSNIKSKENLETILWEINHNKTILSTQSADAELNNRPKIYRGISADATFEHKKKSNLSIGSIVIPSAPLASIVLDNPSNFEEIITSSIQPEKSNISLPLSIHKNTDANLPVDFSLIFEHPLMNQLYEYYNLEDIPRFQLFKRLNRRLTHIRQTLKIMSSNDIELKLKYKGDALIKKRQTPVQSLTKDERIAMAELELNVYEYVQALDEPSSKCFYVNNNDQLETEKLSPIYPVLSAAKSVIISDSSVTPSVSTVNTVQPSAISQSTAILSTTTQFSEKTENFPTWNHSIEPYLMNLFEQLTPLHKPQIHKQLARRYEHICKKAQVLDNTQLQAQIDSKSKALEQNKKILQPNQNELLRIAELELCLFELRNEQIQRNQFD